MSKAATLERWILDEAGDEPIEAVVIGEMGWGDYGHENVPGYDDHPRNRVLTWEEARPHLAYEFDRGYGAPGCEAVWVWTASKVMFVVHYDGSTALHSVPRHPRDGEPEMPGG